MTEFTPIDAKDSDPEYRESVRRSVEAIVGETLLRVEDDTRLIGRWAISFPRIKRAKHPPITYEFLPDGTFQSAGPKSKGVPKSKWKVENGQAMVVTQWCPPMPEFGVEEGFYEEEAFHCALLESGGFVRWNGDGSLIQLFTRAD